MSKLYSNFQGYFRLNIPKIKWIILFGLLFFCLFLIFKKKDWVKHYKKTIISLGAELLLSMNCSFIFVMTLFRRNMDKTREYRVIPFESYRIVFADGNMELLLQIIVNVAMFATLGFLLPCCFQTFEKCRNVVLIVFLGSLGIELIQLIFKMGMFEIDDVIHNVLGAVIGSGVFKLCRKCQFSLRIRWKNDNNKQK